MSTETLALLVSVAGVLLAVGGNIVAILVFSSRISATVAARMTKIETQIEAMTVTLGVIAKHQGDVESIPRMWGTIVKNSERAGSLELRVAVLESQVGSLRAMRRVDPKEHMK